LNYWAADIPQMNGCCPQNQLIPTQPGAAYVIVTDDGTGERTAQISMQWLQVFGVRYVVVSGPESNEAYKDFRHPEKFDGVLRQVWSENGNTIYEVPLVSASLAHVVRPDELVARSPINGIDIEPLQPYVNALLDPSRPPAEFSWTSQKQARIRGLLPYGSIFSVQIPYHAGWRVSTDHGAANLGQDALGFLTVTAPCTGPCDVTLTFDGGREPFLLWSAAIAAWSFLAISGFRRRTEHPPVESN
jgi:hypothetical protein